jgi:acyl-CoA dehydrogenase
MVGHVVRLPGLGRCWRTSFVGWVIDWAIQAFGGAGVTNDFGLAGAFAIARFLRIADGPDEVHRNQIGRLELKKHA